MLINGFRLGITENLENALRDLRNKERNILLWVDAVCINQSDYEERALQVGRMTDIYHTAAHSIIYLGGFEAENLNVLQAFGSNNKPQDSHARILLRPWFSRV